MLARILFLLSLTILILALYHPVLASTCTYSQLCDAGSGYGSGQQSCDGSWTKGLTSCVFDPNVPPNCSQCIATNIPSPSPTIIPSTPTPTPACPPRKQPPTIFTKKSSQGVEYPNLSDQEQQIDNNLQALVPQEVYQETPVPSGYPAPTPAAIPIKVSPQFPNPLAASWCFLSGVFGWLHLFNGYCAASLAPSENIDKVADKAAILASSDIPQEVIPTPGQTDCYLGGGDKDNQDQGNQKINQIDGSLGYKGYYGAAHPQFNELDPQKDNYKNIQNDPTNLLIKQKETKNLNLGGTVFNDDLRVPDVNVQKCMDEKALYPLQTDCQN